MKRLISCIYKSDIDPVCVCVCVCVCMMYHIYIVRMYDISLPYKMKRLISSIYRYVTYACISHAYTDMSLTIGEMYIHFIYDGIYTRRMYISHEYLSNISLTIEEMCQSINQSVL